MRNLSNKLESQNLPPWEKLALNLNTLEGRETMLLLKNFEFLTKQTELVEKNLLEQEYILNSPQPIGPWAPRGAGNNLQFVRENIWDRYLWLEDKDILYPNKQESTFRVCLIGESVASGMFFSPHINPAKVLKTILEQVQPEGAKNIEVIDLSRNAMRIELLLEMIDTASQLNPDILLVFAGNNFCRSHTVGRPDFQASVKDLNKLIGEKGLLSLFDYFSETLEKNTYSAVEKMAENLKEKNIKLIWLLPTVCNTWQRLAPVIWLGEGKTGQWHKNLRKAIIALEREDYEKALEYGWELEKLDGGTCPTSHRIIANAFIGLGNKEKASDHCRKEVDMDCALQRNSFLSPGIQSVVGRVIKDLGKIHEFKVIDLESVFSDYTNSPISDSRMFVDYCHLTPEGMHVAMAAVGYEIVENINGTWKEYIGKIDPPKVNPEIISRGLFEATIYTSHMQHCLELDNGASVLRNRFVEALTMSNGLAETMADYVTMRGGAVVTELSSNAHKIVSSANSLLDYGILQWIHGLDSQTIETICGALDDKGFSGNVLLEKYHQFDKMRLSKGIDLTEPRYLKHFGRDGLVDWDHERGTYRTQPYLRSFWPELPLVFVAEAGSQLQCKLTCRLPPYLNTSNSGNIKVEVNGNQIIEIPLNQKWNKTVFFIDGKFIKHGFNQILLIWPDLPIHEHDIIKEVIHRYQLEYDSNFYPIFGEVFSLHLKSLGKNSFFG